jgi:ATP-dependent protease HslVU (ClpYQ) peptidase subunit
MSNWKDEYRAEKEASGLTWDQFVARKLYHEDDLQDFAGVVADLHAEVEALRTEYEAFRHELNEVRTLLESDEYDP